MSARTIAVRWLFVSTVFSALAHSLPESAIKPLLTYAGLPLEASPAWWLVLSAVISAAVGGLFIWDYRRAGAPRSVFWGSAIWVALSQVVWVALGLAMSGWPDEWKAVVWQGITVPWSAWILDVALFVGVAYLTARVTRPQNPQLSAPGRGQMIMAWTFAGLMILLTVGGFWWLAQMGSA